MGQRVTRWDLKSQRIEDESQPLRQTAFFDQVQFVVRLEVVEIVDEPAYVFGDGRHAAKQLPAWER